jgi:hypothetical protein
MKLSIGYLGTYIIHNQWLLPKCFWWTIQKPIIYIDIDSL